MMKVRSKMFWGLVTVLVVGVSACDDDDDGPTEPKAEVYTASLIGGNEAPTPVTTTATGNATVTFTSTGLDWTLNVTGVPGTITAAHIHAGPTGGPGQVASPILTFPVNTAGLNAGTGLLSSGSATATTTLSQGFTMDSLKAEIRRGRAYVNVHTQANPGGHIRGPLVKQ
jgi:hypothetical protein